MSYQYSVVLLSTLFMIGCTPDSNMRPAVVFPVQWFPDFAMTEMLAKKVPVHSLHDVQALLDKPWDFSYKLANLQTG